MWRSPEERKDSNILTLLYLTTDYFFFLETTVDSINLYPLSNKFRLSYLHVFISSVHEKTFGRLCKNIFAFGSAPGVIITARDVAAAPQTPQLGGAQANFGGPS